MKTALMWPTPNLGVLPQLMKMVIWYQMIGAIVPRLAQLCDTVLAEQVYSLISTGYSFSETLILESLTQNTTY